MGGRFPLMSVIRMKASDDEAKPLSGGGMDRVVERRGLSKPIKLGIGGALLLIAATGFYTMAPSADTQTIAADRVTVSTVERGTFDDFLPLRARVTPLVSVYLRSEEHTSELQSLMRISYAVFCLKKKTPK